MATVTTKQRERALKRQLADLRADWKAWKTGTRPAAAAPIRERLYRLVGCHGGHPALYFCEHTIPDPQECEGCASALYRADQRAAIESDAAVITAELQRLSP